MENNISFERIWAMPNRNTFEILPIRGGWHNDTICTVEIKI